jgi:phospholipid/cholesterol/gamma-HCH transport system permease protein
MATGTLPQLTIQKPSEGILILSLAGEWRLQHALPSTADITNQFEAAGTPDKVLFNTEDLTGWDSGLLIFLSKAIEWYVGKGIPIDREGLPEGVQKLLDLSAPERQRQGITRGEARRPFLARVADAYLGFARSSKETVTFVGEAAYACWRLLRGKARFRISDLFVTIQESGAQALAIVSLIFANRWRLRGACRGRRIRTCMGFSRAYRLSSRGARKGVRGGTW